MLAVAGCLAVELAGQGNWFDAPLWAVNGGSATYLGITVPIDVPTLILVELVLVGGVEVLRIEEKDPAKKVYPGVCQCRFLFAVHSCPGFSSMMYNGADM